MNRTQALREAVECAEKARVLAGDGASAARQGWDGNGAAEAANREAAADFPPGIAGDFPCCAPKAATTTITAAGVEVSE